MEKPITTEETRKKGLPVSIVSAIRKQYRIWSDDNFPNPPTDKLERLARMYNRSVSTISNIIKGKGTYGRGIYKDV